MDTPEHATDTLPGFGALGAADRRALEWIVRALPLSRLHAALRAGAPEMSHRERVAASLLLATVRAVGFVTGDRREAANAWQIVAERSGDVRANMTSSNTATVDGGTSAEQRQFAYDGETDTLNATARSVP